MPVSNGSADAEDGSGAGSDDESGMSSCRGSSPSDPRWSRMTGGTKGWRLRGVEWRVKLGILPGSNASVDAMRRATADGRRKYADLRRRLLVDPHIMDEDQTTSQLRMDNPLSQDPESVWGRYFRNAELEKTIDKDLTRLYPEHGVFFQSTSCQAMMRRILLVWSLIHPQFSYRQGMHELLAPLLYVLHVDVVRLSKVKHRFEDLFDDRFDSLSLQEHYVRDKVESAKNFCGEMIVVGDSINFKGGAETTEESAIDPEEQRVDLSVIIQGSDMYGVEGELGALLSARFLEHDAYCMLDALLDGQGGALSMAEYFQSSSVGGKPPVIEASAAVYRTLAAADESLYTHLVELGVEPQYFALRWLRLLFGREFNLDDLLRVWDAIFEADNTPLYQNGEDDSEMKISQRAALISSFSVSMLLYVRPALLQAPDVTACLKRLLIFPQVPDVKDLIDGAKALQLLAQSAVKSPSKPIPRNIRASDSRVNGKHVRNDSISPPAPQHNVLRSQTPSSPDILRLSMALPGSYWEEKWTHSVLLKKTPDDLFSPRNRTEPVARDFDHVERDDSSAVGTLTRSTSEGRHQRPDQAVAALSVRSYDPYQESSDDDGQEMLRRGGGSSTNDASPKESVIPVANSSRPTKENLDYLGLNLGQDLSLASTSAPALEQGPSSVSRSSHRRSSSVSSPGTVSSEALESAMFGDDPAGSTDVVNKFEFTTSDLGNQRDLTEQYRDTSETSAEASNRQAQTEGSSETQYISHPGMILMEDNENEVNAPVSLPTIDTGGGEESSVLELEQSNALQPSEVTTDMQLVDGILSPNVGIDKFPEVEGKSQDKETNGDSQLMEGQSESCGMTECEGDHSVEVGISENAETLLPSKSKPPLPPSRLGRFGWMWNLGRSSLGEKTAAIKSSKEDSPGSDVPSNLSVTSSDSEVSNRAAAANAAQRRKKSWWRANTDVVPEECVATTGTDSGNAVDAGSDVPGPVDLAKDVSGSAVVASGANLKEDVVEEIPVYMEDTAKEPQDMTPFRESQAPRQEAVTQPDDITPCAAVVQEPGQDAAEEPQDGNPSATLQAVSEDAAKMPKEITQSAALQALGQETTKMPKDITPSAALQALLGQDAAKKSKDMTLQALGQAVLEHVQVLESALAQKVTVLDIGSMMWTPAVREKSDNTNKVGLGSKGQAAAIAAIAELRKISQVLQQM